MNTGYYLMYFEEVISVTHHTSASLLRRLLDGAWILRVRVANVIPQTLVCTRASSDL